MPIDRYTRVVLTVIAGALVYLCAAFTVGPPVGAQTTVRPGEISSAPLSVVVVGWRTPAGQVVPVAVQNTVSTSVQNTVQVTGRVTTERSIGAADRVVLVGWEEGADVARPGMNFRVFDSTTPRPGLPTSSIPR